jgi:hypothetical protein
VSHRTWYAKIILLLCGALKIFGIMGRKMSDLSERMIEAEVRECDIGNWYAIHLLVGSYWLFDISGQKRYCLGSFRTRAAATAWIDEWENLIRHFPNNHPDRARILA